MAPVLRNDVSPATAPKSAILKVSAGNDVFTIAFSISAANFHLSLPVHEHMAMTSRRLRGRIILLID
jgi:hypothetical protein